MANLAIKGHATRGKEVIEILEMLGGNNTTYDLDGSDENAYYYIHHGYIDADHKDMIGEPHPEFKHYTLEEFLEKFPYKVGNKAFAFGNKCTIIDSVWDGGIDEVVYTIRLDISKYTTTKLSNQLQPYKEETIDKANKAVFDANAQCCDIMNRLIKEETMEEINLQQCRNKKQAKVLCDKFGVSIKEVVLGNIETIINGLQNISHKIENSEPCVNEDWVKVAVPLNEMMNALGNHWYID